VAGADRASEGLGSADDAAGLVAAAAERTACDPGSSLAAHPATSNGSAAQARASATGRGTIIGTPGRSTAEAYADSVQDRPDPPAWQHDAVAERLNPLDASFLYLERTATPMHSGSVATFQAPAEGFDLDRLAGLIRERIPYVPRYRQKAKLVPGRLANPVWVDDEDFDLAYHVRRSALPRPGGDDQLQELVARVMSRRLDRDRPLWEVYLVEGLAGDRFAVLTKTHNAVVDGVGAVDIGQVLFDLTPEPRDTPADAWRPAPEPSWLDLVGAAAADAIRRPTAVVDTLRSGVDDLRATGERLVGILGDVAAALGTAARRAPDSPLNVDISAQRRWLTLDTDLDTYREVRRAHGGTVNDVVLAAVAGGLRAWLLTRGEPVRPSTTVRALVPVSVRAPAEATDTADGGGSVTSVLVDLPVGEPSPAVRLHRVSYAMQAHQESGRAVGAESLAALGGFAPPTLHSLGARVTSGLSRRLFNLVVTNVPGPQVPLYADGARMLAAYPVMPLAMGQALAIGVTSYDGRVFYGLNADRAAMPDLDVLVQCLADALEELADTSRAAAPRRRPRKRARAEGRG
jgi:WS/DGAT/MGAT family acyltransferase